MGCCLSGPEERRGLAMGTSSSSASSSAGMDVAAGTFASKYAVEEELGRGAYSVVRAATNRHTGEQVAAKIIQRRKISKVDLDALQTEVAILRELRHPNVVQLVEVFDDATVDPDEIQLVLERIDGGELFERIVAKQFYSERDARDLAYMLLTTTKYLHDHDVVHKDLKPENLLLASRTDDACVKLADFGFAARVTPADQFCLTAACGTPGYVAPEILTKTPHGKPVDLWSIGVILYILLGGYPPFADENKKRLYASIKAADFQFHPEYWGNVSEEAKDLIRRLLTVDMHARLTADQALKHSWIERSASELASRDLNSNLVAFKRFNARRKLRAGIKAVVAANRWKNLIGGLRSDRDSVDMVRPSEIGLSLGEADKPTA